MTLRECVACLLIKDRAILAEKRRATKTLAPGATAIPGGHVENGERLEQALERELQEELGIAPLDIRYVCTLLHRAEELRRLHYFAVEAWEGEIQNREAEALLWVRLDAPSLLDLDVDRTAVSEYVRMYRDHSPLTRHADSVSDRER